METGAVIVEAGVTPVRDALLPPKRPRLPRKILMPLSCGAVTGTATGTTTGLVAGTTTGTAGTTGTTTGAAAGTTTGTTGVITDVAGPALLIRMLRRAIGGDPMVVVGAVVETGVVAATEAGASPGVNTIKS